MAQEREEIKGVKLATNCPILTHVVYADDLILLGHAEDGEVQQLCDIMEEFGAVSGLAINPTKSKLWFLEPCEEQLVWTIQNKLRADEARDEERYLGAILSKSNTAKKTGMMLLDKIKSKLTGWRSNMLSHAGRLVLIKSVLMSVPVYYMSVEMIPKGIIRQMESQIAKFFWGKTDKDRYMSFISWKRICQPVDRGGLGVRKLSTFGEALLLKLVWDMASEEDKIWVQVCRSKYYSILGFWRAVNVGGTSNIWKQEVKLRHTFKENVMWQVAKGDKIPALSQPWFPEWRVAQQASRNDRKITVSDLFDFDTNQWNLQEMRRLLGDETARQIDSLIQKLRSIPSMTDRLVWSHTKSGSYTVKDGYDYLIQNREIQGQEVQWKYIWKWKNVSPKIKVFMWRLLSDGLPLAQNLHNRIQSISPMCVRCNQENEYATHCFFFCQGSRMVWFAGSLGISTDSLPLNVCEALHMITQQMNEENIRIFCLTLWEIWLARNDLVFQHRRFDPIAICKKVQAMGHAIEGARGENLELHQLVERVPYELSVDEWQVLVDASWDTSQRAGSACVIYHEGVLVRILMQRHEAPDSFYAETLALQEAIQWVEEFFQAREGQKVKLFSDCLNLTTAIHEGDLTSIPSWRAAPLIARMLEQIENWGGKVSLQHVRREAVNPAHVLANEARRKNVTYNGIATAAIMCENRIGMALDRRFFQQVEEAPP
ncbi:RNA-directed DNA polymerase (reverse transcriptase)-related family protein [Rhynchospora pubera]|uniref:RNA-directed DNA polymerase (Reverse transcriptase)-related family protein n=1 Tax=Rhynchospora pubera TaxID=906938 RepID=A0AAV8FUV5_9POAL|nr:RNA-directed DNA polymerase (reverse transcriptase)-related family protein [Rhynchospora pubera]